MSSFDAAPLPRLGEVFFDVRGDSRSMRLSWYGDTSVAVFSIWQGGRCTGTFRLPVDDLERMVATLQGGAGAPGAAPPGPALAAVREEPARSPSRPPLDLPPPPEDEYAASYDGASYDGASYDGERYPADNYGQESYPPDHYGAENYGPGEYGDYGSENYPQEAYDPAAYGSGNYAEGAYPPAGYGQDNYQRAGYENYGSENHGPENYAADNFGAENHAADNYGEPYSPANYGAEAYGTDPRSGRAPERRYDTDHYDRPAPDYPAGSHGSARGGYGDEYATPSASHHRTYAERDRGLAPDDQPRRSRHGRAS